FFESHPEKTLRRDEQLGNADADERGEEPRANRTAAQQESEPEECGRCEDAEEEEGAAREERGGAPAAGVRGRHRLLARNVRNSEPPLLSRRWTTRTHADPLISCRT